MIVRKRKTQHTHARACCSLFPDTLLFTSGSTLRAYHSNRRFAALSKARLLSHQALLCRRVYACIASALPTTNRYAITGRGGHLPGPQRATLPAWLRLRLHAAPTMMMMPPELPGRRPRPVEASGGQI